MAAALPGDFRSGQEADPVGLQPGSAEHGLVEGPGEILEFAGHDYVEGRIVVGGLAHHPVELVPASRRVVVAGGDFELLCKLDFTQNPGKVMDDITFVRSHWWLVSEGFSLSTANSDVQKLPATLYHRIADSLAYAA